MNLFCPDCDDEVETEVDDCSFDHEFGTRWLIDYYCTQCHRLLLTEHSRPRKEVEEP